MNTVTFPRLRAKPTRTYAVVKDEPRNAPFQPPVSREGTLFDPSGSSEAQVAFAQANYQRERELGSRLFMNTTELNFIGGLFAAKNSGVHMTQADFERDLRMLCGMEQRGWIDLQKDDKEQYTRRVAVSKRFKRWCDVFVEQNKDAQGRVCWYFEKVVIIVDDDLKTVEAPPAP